jgi:nitrogen fixation/metabolism regulation signal transduction histidine kinase
MGQAKDELIKKFMKKNTIVIFSIALILTLYSSLANADTGKIIPDEFLWLLLTVGIALLVFTVFFLSTLIKLIYRKNKEKEPKKLTLIILLTILPPIFWLYAEANYHLLYTIESNSDYKTKEIFNKAIAILTAMLGMGIGFVLKKILK